MASLFKLIMYGYINTYDTTTNWLYVIQFLSEAYTLQNNTTIDGKVISYGKLVVNAQYLFSIQGTTNWYWNQQPLQQTITVPTCTILLPRIEFIIIRYVQDIPKKLCDRSEAKTLTQGHPIIVTGADNNYIMDKIERREKIELESNVGINIDDSLH